MPEAVLSPALPMLFGALLVAVGPARLLAVIALAAPLATLYAAWQVPDGVQATVALLGHELQLVEGGAVQRLFATVFAVMAFGGALFALGQARRAEMAAAMAYAAGAIGVSFAGDLIVLFVFWELMALASIVVVWCGNTGDSRQAGIRYAIVHLVGGALLMAGIAGLMVDTGSAEIRALELDGFDTWLILAGLLVNAAAPPLSAWLADAYPESSPTGGVFLSAFTTKAAVLALILLFPGTGVLVWIGLWMIFYGILYALLENDMRRILSYSIVNQVGFMVVGVGIGTEMALNGAAAHAFTHIIYKGLLFMSAGAVLYRTGRRKCSDLGGLYQTMPLTTVCGIVGALSISAFPLTSGFVSKSMISAGAAAEHWATVYFLLAAASAGVFLHAGIKYPWFVFFQKDSGLRPPEAPLNMRLAMGLFALLCVAIGVMPGMLYGMLPYAVDYAPYTGGHVLSQLQLLLFAGLAFFLMLPLMRRTPTITLDFDWAWRALLPRAARAARAAALAVAGSSGRALREPGRRLAAGFGGLFSEGGVFSRSWAIGTTALLLALLLSIYVLMHYL